MKVLIHKAKRLDYPETACDIKLAHNTSIDWRLVNCKKCLQKKPISDKK